MIDPSKVCLFIPPELKRFKLELFERIGKQLGRVVHGDTALLDALPDEIIPVIGCTPALRPLIDRWKTRRRTFIYWDRGYLRRVFATSLPRGHDGGYYRWHLNNYQMTRIGDVPSDRFKSLIPGNKTDWKKLEVLPWRKGGRHIVVAQPTKTYSQFHAIDGWTDKTVDALALVTDRQIIIRGKESKRPLQKDLEGAHCLVAHASIAAVEAVVLGCPVFVDWSSAAALVGKTELKEIESPVYPERDPWLWSLAYSQFNEAELVNGYLWKTLQ